MTVLDTSVPHVPVLMVLDDHESVADVELPAGYRFAAWEPRFREPWVRLHVLLGQLPSYDEGLAYFDRTYESDPAALERQMILVVDERGELAGTSSLWSGDHFGEPRLRVHWVGVSPDHQRRGLARVLMLETIRTHATIGFPLYWGITAVAAPTVLLLFGSKWAPAIVPLAALAFVGPFRLIGSIETPLMTGLGRPDVLLKTKLVLVPCMTIALGVGVKSEFFKGQSTLGDGICHDDRSITGRGRRKVGLHSL